MNCHIIMTPFSGVGLHGGFRGEKWFKHRIDIFKKYTLQSLAHQTNKEFIHWISFRSEEREHPLVKELAKYLKTIKGYNFIFTFNGLMYWDDKFNNYNFKVRIRNLLMMLWDCYIYREFKNPIKLLKNTWEDKNKTLLSRITVSLDELRSSIGMDYEWVYLTRIDSDDMFNINVVNLIQSQTPEENKALVFDKGYIYNHITGQLGEWNPPTNPPFHTIIFPASTFFNPEKYLEYYKDFKSHEDITRVFNCMTLDMYKYCVSFHGKHISTAWESPVPKKLYHKIKYGKYSPFKHEVKGYCYTTSGKNISTHWESRLRKKRNTMIGKEFDDKIDILKDFGIKYGNE